MVLPPRHNSIDDHVNHFIFLATNDPSELRPAISSLSQREKFECLAHPKLKLYGRRTNRAVLATVVEHLYSYTIHTFMRWLLVELKASNSKAVGFSITYVNSVVAKYFGSIEGVSLIAKTMKALEYRELAIGMGATRYKEVLSQMEAFREHIALLMKIDTSNITYPFEKFES